MKVLLSYFNKFKENDIILTKKYLNNYLVESLN